MTRQQYSRTSSRPVIEEVDSDDDSTPTSHAKHWVEEPDEDHHHRSSSKHSSKHRIGEEVPIRRTRSNRSQSLNIRPSMLSALDPFGDDDFFNFGSMSKRMDSIFGEFDSAMSRAMSDMENPRDGSAVFYSSKTTFASSNGVSATTQAVKDSRSGTEKLSVRRTIGDKSHMVEKVVDREGRETTTKRLKNLRDDEEGMFDQQWNHASSALPLPRHGTSGGASRSIRDRSSSSSHRAIPIEDGKSSRRR